jgi:hypothetical protein
LLSFILFKPVKSIRNQAQPFATYESQCTLKHIPIIRGDEWLYSAGTKYLPANPATIIDKSLAARNPQ